ncbi:MAG: hypothetical protein R2857_13865 [Vampirovibrionales bacterium]
MVLTHGGPCRATDQGNRLQPVATLHQPTGRRWCCSGAFPDSRTLLCNENGFWVDYQSDRYGFRNPDTVWDQPTADVLLVGDSFTHIANDRRLPWPAGFGTWAQGD